MADKSESITLKVNTKMMEIGVKATTKILNGLSKVLSSIGEGVAEAFTVNGYQDYRKTVSRFGKDLANELLQLQLSFGAMKYAIAEAVAPIASV